LSGGTGPDGPLIACGESVLRLIEVQPDGKKPMPGGAYLNSHKLQGHNELGRIPDGRTTEVTKARRISTQSRDRAQRL
jgi:hypothetical protein